MLTTDRRPGRRRTTDRTPVENDAYAGMMARCIRALGRRIAAGNLEDIALALDLRRQLDDATDDAVRDLHSQGESWERIGRAVGMTKQAAQQRWGAKAGS